MLEYDDFNRIMNESYCEIIDMLKDEKEVKKIMKGLYLEAYRKQFAELISDRLFGKAAGKKDG